MRFDIWMQNVKFNQKEKKLFEATFEGKAKDFQKKITDLCKQIGEGFDPNPFSEHAQVEITEDDIKVPASFCMLDDYVALAVALSLILEEGAIDFQQIPELNDDLRYLIEVMPGWVKLSKKEFVTIGELNLKEAV